MKTTCPVCGKAKAVRHCPALKQLICPQCCGKGRQRSIDCPEDCGYLSQSRERAVARLLSLAGDPGFESVWPDVLHNLRLALVRVQQGRVADLTDSECMEAVGNASDTLRTRSKGLIYEYRSHNPHAQLAADELLQVVGNHETGQKGFRRVGIEDLGRCLRYLKQQFEESEKRGTGYLSLAAQAVGRQYVAGEGAGPSHGRPEVHTL